MRHAPGRVDAAVGGHALDAVAEPSGTAQVRPLGDEGWAAAASVTCDETSAVITVAGLADRVDHTADVLRVVAAAGATAEMVTVVPISRGLVDLLFVVASRRCAAVTSVLAAAQPTLGFRQVRCEHKLFRLLLPGPGVGADLPAARWREMLRRAGVSVLTCAVVPGRVEAMCRIGVAGAVLPQLRAALDAAGHRLASGLGRPRPVTVSFDIRARRTRSGRSGSADRSS
jgi:hypothetical protein